MKYKSVKITPCRTGCLFEAMAGEQTASGAGFGAL
jgi:hypothetical protein